MVKHFNDNDFIQAIIREANTIRLPKCLDDDTWGILEQSGMEVSVPVSYLLSPMIGTVAHFMGNSHFQVGKNFKQKFIFYTALLANPSSGRSEAMETFFNAASLVEKANNMDGLSSSLRNPATAEYLIGMLKSNPRIISFWNVASAFTESLNRCTAGSTSRDRRIYLELFNGPDVFSSDLKATSTQLVNPSLNIVLGGHPSTLIEQIKEEKLRFDDGLFQSFLFNAPQGLVNIKEEDIYNSVEPSISLSSILYTIQQICSKPRVFRFEADAFTEYLKILNGYRILIEQSENYDDFICAMFSKAKTHLIRLAGVINIFSKTITLLKLIPASKLNSIEEPFKAIIRYQLENNHKFIQAACTVGIESLKQAEILLKYFNGHRVVLAGYHFNLNKLGAFNLNEEVALYLKKLHSIKPIMNLSERITDKKLLNVIRQILVFKGKIVNNTKLCSKHRLKNDLTTPAFEYLQKVGLGSIEIKESANKKKVIHFIKINPDELESNIKIIDLLRYLKVEVNEYIQAYNDFIEDYNLSVTETIANESCTFEEKNYSQINPSKANYGIQLANYNVSNTTNLNSKNFITPTALSPLHDEEKFKINNAFGKLV